MVIFTYSSANNESKLSLEEWVRLLVIIISLAISFVFYYVIQAMDSKRQRKRIQDILSTVTLVDDLHKTLLAGLYQRFKKETERDEDGKSYVVKRTKDKDGKEITEKKEDPLDFEYFVARVLEAYYGGKAYVTKGSGDYGVDIEHQRPEGLYLVQVKCYAPGNKVDYEPIAIIHSQIVKQRAIGGMVITTSSFTKPALQYDHQRLNIDLIEGLDLVRMWSVAMEQKKQTFFEEAND